MTHPARPSTLCALAAATLLAACSAIQIDVDVYKGPLSHEPDIQVQQFAATAIAARPLLSSLRADLEIEHRSLNRQQPLSNSEKEMLRRATRYIDDKLESRLARFVNGALFSYDDLGAPEVQDLRRAHDRLRRAMQVLEIQEIDRKIGRSIRPDPNDGFAAAYRRFLCGVQTCEPDTREGANYRPEPGMVYPSRPLAPASAAKAAASAAVPAAPPIQVLPLGGPAEFPGHCPPDLALVSACTLVKRSNAGFALLALHEPVVHHSKRLFGAERVDFIGRVNDLGRAYHEARTAMREVLHASIQLLRQAPQARRDDWIEVGAKASSIATQLPFLAAYLHAGIHPDISGLPAAQRLLGAWHLPRDTLVGDTRARSAAANNPYPPMQEALRVLARQQPQQTADLLQAVDSRLPLLSPDERRRLARADVVHRSYRDNLHDESALDYGLARSLVNDAELSATVDSLGAEVSALGDNASGFETARLSNGIDSLTRVYREELARAGGKLNDERVQRATRQLQESLLFFAERLLLVTNTLTQRVLADELPGMPQKTLASFAGRMATLQTLGNTLVLHANDLTRRQHHDLRQKERGPGEALAASAVYAPPPAVAFDALMLGVATEARVLETRQSQATNNADTWAKATEQAQQQLEGAAEAVRLAKNREKTAQDETFALEATLRTLMLPRTTRPQLAAPADPGEAAQERRDREALAQEVKALQQRPTPLLNQSDRDGFLAALAKAVAALPVSPRDTDGTRKRRGAAVQLLGDASATVLEIDPVHTQVDTAMPALLGQLEQAFNARRKQLEQARQELRLAEQNEIRAKRQRQSAGEQETANKNLAQRASTLLPLNERLRSVMLAHRRSVLDQAEAAHVRDAAALHRMLLDAVKASLDKETDESRKTGLREAMQMLSRHTPPARIALDAKAVDGSTPRDVLDQVIAALRHQRIEATATGQTERADQLAKAIEQAYEARQASTFLRPAADYLKSVYSSTALADGPESPYKNLLTDYLRYLKVDRFDDRDEYERITRDAKENAEKLFWQNINRVTVSGGGSTNTVLAKDDVGNWYLKSYDADPSTVIRSAQSLALFGMGRKIDRNLLRRAELQRRSDDPSIDTGERDRARSELDQLGPDTAAGLQRVNDRLRLQYLDSSREHATQLREKMMALPAALQTAAKAKTAIADSPAATTGFSKLVDTAHINHLAALIDRQLPPAIALPASRSDTVSAIDTAIVESLRGLLKVRRELTETVTAKALGDNDAAAQEARSLVQAQLKALIQDTASRQKLLLDRLDNGLQLIGEARTTP